MRVAVQKKSLCRGQIILSLMLFLPAIAAAHLISITATTPFPATVAAPSSTTAVFTITNITSRANLTAVNQSNFPETSGLSIASSTCGNLLGPGQTCQIQVRFQPIVAGRVSTALKIWAKPSADGVQYPINIMVTEGLPKITLVPVNTGSLISALPALRDPAIAISSGYWLIVSGSMGNFHDFNATFNPSIYVFNPLTNELHSISITSSNLPLAVKNQLASSNPEFYQDGDTLYLIGGFFTPNNIIFTTLNTITAINVPGMINAVINGDTNLAPYVNTNSTTPQFRVAGGQLNKIGDYFYLTFGQNCEGAYCAILQVYTNSIFKFITDPTLATTTIVDTATHNNFDGSGWRRRDYTLAPFMLGSSERLLALGGPFTPGSEALVWTNGILFDINLLSNDNFISNQKANQYLAPKLSMYSSSRQISYVATFSGLSALYWSTSGLVYDITAPYGNILDLITSDASGNVQEYANLQPLCSGHPVASCLYMGLAAEFIHTENHYNSRHILMLDELPQNTPTLVGYIYGGLLSPVQDIFDDNQSYTTNQVYAVYVTPAGAKIATWVNITDFSTT